MQVNLHNTLTAEVQLFVCKDGTCAECTVCNRPDKEGVYLARRVCGAHACGRKFDVFIRPNLSVNEGKAVYKCGVLFFSISMSLAFVLSLPFKV